ncbi:hypothetical protein [Halostella litorea]|uniref:hypothetical protein n=1 Tax=Halostella litorea TaxID=2528831 RepID=UPI001091BD9C|nr:hypothetical protein [Halostella litorea]
MAIETVRDEHIADECAHLELAAGDVQVFLTWVVDTVSVVVVDGDWQGSVTIDDGRRVRGDPV